MTSDSSDEENLDLLKEAQDSQFINDSMFSDTPSKSTSETQNKKPLPSLRPTKNVDGQFNLLKVTPEFRNYVARQLSGILDRKLSKKFADLEDPEIPSKKRKRSGVKLLSDSKHFLEVSERDIAENKATATHNFQAKSVKNKDKTKGDVTEDSLKEVVVSPEDILSKKEVKNWSKRSKAPVFSYKKTKNGELKLMSHMPPFRLNVPNLGPDMPAAPSTKKRRKNNQAPIQPPPNVQDLLPPPLSGYGDTIVASNPFDDCPSSVNINAMSRNPGGPPMGMGGPGPNMVMANNMGMYRPMCPNPPMGMGSPMMHSPNAHQMNNPMMMNGPRMNHMGPGPGPGHGPPHMMPSPNGPGPGGPMGPNMNMTGPPMHSPIASMGPLTGPGPGSGPGPMGSPMGPMNGGPMNGPPMGGHGPHGPHPQHGGPGGPGNMSMSTPNGPIGPPMNNNFIMSPMNNMYSKPMPVSAGKVYPVDQPMVFNSQNPNAPPIYPCGVCHKEVHDNDQAILCESGCNFWFHRGCTGLTEAAFQLLTAEVYAEWVCDKCLQSKNIPLVKFKP